MYVVLKNVHIVQLYPISDFRRKLLSVIFNTAQEEYPIRTDS